MEFFQSNETYNKPGCKLLDSFAIFIQVILACLAFSTLIIKRQREIPQRPFFIWLLDVSKQVIGGGIVHSLNIIASHLFGTSLEGELQSNPCVWYFLNILVDTTFGVLVIWAVLLLAQHITRFYQLKGFESGVYGEGDCIEQFKSWSKQLGVYILALIAMKIVVVILFGLCPWLRRFGEWVLGWTMGNYKIQVIFVMLIFPLIMNIIQFWIVDTIVKHKARSLQLNLDEEDNMLTSDDEYENRNEQDETNLQPFDNKIR